MDYHATPLPHHTSPLLTLPHGMFSCHGGTSAPPFDSLNLSFHVGDQPDRVQENRQRVATALGLRHIASVEQIHSDRIFRVGKSHLAAEPAGYDALISTLPGVGLMIQQADCQAVLLAAPGQTVIAAVHCGWRGSVLDIVGQVIRCLQTQYDVDAASLTAVISPSLGPCCAEFLHYRQELPEWMHAYQTTAYHFDFWAMTRHQLLKTGVLPERIDTAGICTRCGREYFSYRRAKGQSQGITGRNGSIIGLPLS